MKLRWIILLGISFLALSLGRANEPIKAHEEERTENDHRSHATKNEEKKNTSLEFNNLRNIINNDQLELTLKKQQEEQDQKKKEREKAIIAKYQIPNEQEFWSFFSDYWIVKNTQKLSWDSKKADFGLNETFAYFLESVGFYEVNFKVLVVETPSLFHVALPANPKEYIFLISLPFMRMPNCLTAPSAIPDPIGQPSARNRG